MANPAPAPGPVHVDDDECDDVFRDFIAELFITKSKSGPVTQKDLPQGCESKGRGSV